MNLAALLSYLPLVEFGGIDGRRPNPEAPEINRGKIDTRRDTLGIIDPGHYKEKLLSLLAQKDGPCHLTIESFDLKIKNPKDPIFQEIDPDILFKAMSVANVMNSCLEDAIKIAIKCRTKKT